jgi:hypothetical protein
VAQENTLGVSCSEEGCAETVVASVEERPLCRRHFLAFSYRALESIDAKIVESEFHENHGEATGRLLEECMRHAADIACAPVAPANIEKAQVLDVLLWASELHARLRRSARVPARIPILVRSEAPERPWEEKTQTELLSRHGFQFACRHEINPSDKLICIRLDNGWRTEARVAWTQRKDSGEILAGLEFLTDANFWALGGGAQESTAPKR